MTLGHYPEALVIGYLRNQGIIDKISDLNSVHVDWSVNTAAVTSKGLDLDKVNNKLKHKAIPPKRERYKEYLNNLSLFS